MANEFRVCDECKTTNIKSILPRLKQLDPEATIKIGCQSYCGIGFKKPFLVVNDSYITGKTEDDLIEKTKKFLK